MKTSNKSVSRLRPVAGVMALFTMVSFSACTKNFEKYNTRPDALTTAQTASVLASAFGPIEVNILHNYQTAQNLSADQYSGYLMSPSFAGANQNYNLNNGWNTDGFNNPYQYVMAPIQKNLAPILRTAIPDQYAIALLLEVMAMDRVTDKFGPIPYTQAGTSTFSAPYDDQKTIYTTFFKQLDTAVTNLTTYISNGKATPLGNNDFIYGGDLTKWLKLANTLRLRLAMHIVKVDPADAQTEAAKAINDPGGLLSVAADDAQIGGQNPNPLWQEEGWGDLRFNAALATYLVGFNDPRLPIYAMPATLTGHVGEYIGLRTGGVVDKATYDAYADININTFGRTTPYPYMSAAEAWFLKAEYALRWGSKTDAQTYYETGIRTSFAQWGVTDATTIANYIADGTSTEADYTDPKNSLNSSPAVSTITIKWDPAADNEHMLERIITQKWLAMFPEGQEAWTEFRRTGYPKLFTVVNNESNGTIDTQIQIRRLAYPLNEYTTNGDAVAAGVKLLGGPDNGGTRLWWDVEGGNF
jgi:hypothetical protein